MFFTKPREEKIYCLKGEKPIAVKVKTTFSIGSPILQGETKFFPIYRKIAVIPTEDVNFLTGDERVNLDREIRDIAVPCNLYDYLQCDSASAAEDYCESLRKEEERVVNITTYSFKKEEPK